MEHDVLENGAAVVARLESNLNSTLDRSIAQSTASDLVAAVAPIRAVAFVLDHASGERCLAQDGVRNHAAVDISVGRMITNEQRLRVDFWHSENCDTQTRAALQEIAEAVGGLMVGLVARIQLQEQEGEGQVLDELTSTLFRDLPLPERMHQLAVELSAAFQVDRLNLFDASGGKPRLIASSAQSRFDRRAERVAESEAVATTLIRELNSNSAESMVVDHHARVGHESVTQFLDHGRCQALLARWITPDEVFALGEVDDFSGWNQPSINRSQRAIFTAAIVDSLRSKSSWSWFGLRRRFVDWASPFRIALVAAAVTILALFPMTIQVSADGRVVPRTEFIVHAPVTGQIERMQCESGTHVDQGQVLCEFSSHDVELDLSRLRGEILTVQEQLEIAATRRGDESAEDISSDRRVLNVKLAGLKSQLDVLIKRQRELTVRSPIAGIVSLELADDLGSYDVGRPVLIGQAMIRVINPADGYRIELDVPDQEIGYVVDALERSDTRPVDVRFRLRAEPETEHHGVLTQLDETASLGRLGQRIVNATVEPDASSTEFAAESGVIGWVECERRAAGWVLCRKVIERLRLWGWM